jgi:hypothetical protein
MIVATCHNFRILVYILNLEINPRVSSAEWLLASLEKLWSMELVWSGDSQHCTYLLNRENIYFLRLYSDY